MSTEMVKKRKAIEPDMVEKMPSGSRFMLDHDKTMCGLWGYNETLLPNHFMRALGYTRHPRDCNHMRKRFKTRWTCADCGTDL